MATLAPVLTPGGISPNQAVAEVPPLRAEMLQTNPRTINSPHSCDSAP